MPYKSEAQRSYFHWKANTEGGEWKDRAAHWDKATPKGKKLPKRVRKEEFEKAVDEALNEVMSKGAIKSVAKGARKAPAKGATDKSESEPPEQNEGD